MNGQRCNFDPGPVHANVDSIFVLLVKTSYSAKNQPDIPGQRSRNQKTFLQGDKQPLRAQRSHKVRKECKN
ncbi:hypothetical protein [Caldithrix abyssi]|uniref:hypothetical protein n=1 Tax=Caldithrix abyssi TaxID=187145 RepID=UPI001237631B|nr:hypothetical protein [Caldithrix abyssi]